MAEARAESLLVLCVDRDNDVGEVIKVETPIVGEAVKSVAADFAAKKPEDSDVNAIFAALKLYYELKERGGLEKVGIALVAGHKDEGIKADMRIAEELDQILSREKFDGVVLVSDGPTDEAVLPILQSRLPVVSVHRVVVQQSRGVEESFLLFLRYARRLFEDEKYRKYALGVPGALFTLYILLSLVLPGYAWPILLLALGVSMTVKGFSLDEQLKGVYRSSPILFTTIIVSVMIAALALTVGLTRVLSLGRSVNSLEAIGYFLLANLGEQLLVLDLFFLAIMLPFAAHMVEAILGVKGLEVGGVCAVVLLVLLRQVLYEYSKILIGVGSIYSLLLWVVVAISVLAMVAAVLPRVAERLGSSQ